MSITFLLGTCQYLHPIYKDKTGDESRKQDTQASKGSPLLSEEFPYGLPNLNYLQHAFMYT